MKENTLRRISLHLKYPYHRCASSFFFYTLSQVNQNHTKEVFFILVSMQLLIQVISHLLLLIQVISHLLLLIQVISHLLLLIQVIMHLLLLIQVIMHLLLMQVIMHLLLSVGVSKLRRSQ